MDPTDTRRRSQRLRAIPKRDKKCEKKESLRKRNHDLTTCDDPKETTANKKQKRVKNGTKKPLTKRNLTSHRETPNSQTKTDASKLPEMLLERKTKKAVPKMRSKKATAAVGSENIAPQGMIEDNIPKRTTKKATPKGKKPATSAKTQRTTTKPKSRKTKTETIHDQLEALGIGYSSKHGNCARAAILNGFIKFTGRRSDLEQVIVSDTMMCGHKVDAKLKDLLEQPDYAGLDYEDGLKYATVICPQCAPDSDASDDEQQARSRDTGEGRTYVTDICMGKPRFDDGKGHNHCMVCKKFGKCIGDYRQEHCYNCNGHYFAGFSGRFHCPRCFESDDDVEDRDVCTLM